jgi:hypothetical protein
LSETVPSFGGSMLMQHHTQHPPATCLYEAYRICTVQQVQMVAWTTMRLFRFQHRRTSSRLIILRCMPLRTRLLRAILALHVYIAV